MRIAVYMNDLKSPFQDRWEDPDVDPLFEFEQDTLGALALLIHVEEGGTSRVEEIEAVLLRKMQFVGRQYYYFLIDCPNCKDHREDSCRCGWIIGEPLDLIDNYEACPGCDCMPGDGLTESCNDPLGCGYWRAEHLTTTPHGAAPDRVGSVQEMPETNMIAVLMTRDTAQSVEHAIIELMDRRDREDEKYWKGLERALEALKESFGEL